MVGHAWSVAEDYLCNHLLPCLPWVQICRYMLGCELKHPPSSCCSSVIRQRPVKTTPLRHEQEVGPRTRSIKQPTTTKNAGSHQDPAATPVVTGCVGSRLPGLAWPNTAQQ